MVVENVIKIQPGSLLFFFRVGEPYIELRMTIFRKIYNPDRQGHRFFRRAARPPDAVVGSVISILAECNEIVQRIRFCMVAKKLLDSLPAAATGLSRFLVEFQQGG